MANLEQLITWQLIDISNTNDLQGCFEQFGGLGLSSIFNLATC